VSTRQAHTRRPPACGLSQQSQQRGSGDVGYGVGAARGSQLAAAMGLAAALGVFGGRATRLAGAVRRWRREVSLSSPLEEREGGQHTNHHGRHHAWRKGTTPAVRPALQLRGRCVRCCILTAVGTALKNDSFFLRACTTYRHRVVRRTLNCAHRQMYRLFIQPKDRDVVCKLFNVLHVV
jgi:hypothetical protein